MLCKCVAVGTAKQSRHMMDQAQMPCCRMSWGLSSCIDGLIRCNRKLTTVCLGMEALQTVNVCQSTLASSMYWPDGGPRKTLCCLLCRLTRVLKSWKNMGNSPII